MSTNFGSPGSIVSGRMAQAGKKTENTFGTANRASDVTGNKMLDTGDMRMAGEVGARAVCLPAPVLERYRKPGHQRPTVG